MLDTGSISLILILIIGGISVYYIFADAAGKKQVEEFDKEQVKADTATVEPVKEEPKVQEIKTKQTATNTQVNGDTMQQTEDYNPSVSVPLPKMPKAVQGEAVQENTPISQQTPHMMPESHVDSELTMEDLKGSDELIKVTCQWCDFVVEMRKGETMVCPRCSGTIES